MQIKYKLQDFPEPGDQDLFRGINDMNKHDYQSALKQFEKASTYENEYGLVFGGIFYLGGFGTTKRDPLKALGYFKHAASEWKNPVAQYILGIMYFEGDKDIKVDIKVAFEYLLLAANNGWSDAMAHLGAGYNCDGYIKENLEMAVSWLEKVANKDDNNDELINDGTLYLFGNKEFELDLGNLSDSVLSMVRGTTSEGIISPVQCLSQITNINSNTCEDLAKRIIFWDIMTNKKSNSVAACQLLLAAIYSTGGKNFTMNREKSHYWFKKSAKNGNSSACVGVGMNYEKGVGVEQNYKEAMLWYIKSKELGGELEALHSIGRLYYNGHGVGQDHKLAMDYFNTYIQHGESGDVYFLMGEIYKTGKYGVKQDYEKAFELFSKASDKGHGGAATRIGLFYRNGFNLPKDETKAFEWLTKGADLNCPMAQFTLGQIYREGYKGKIDNAKALEYFKKSLQNGFHPAECMIKQLTIQETLNNLNI